MKIVVADDHPLYLDAARQLLSRAFKGAEIFCASTFAEALALIGEKTPELTLADYSMPEAGDVVSIRKLVAAAGQAPVVIMSGIARARDVQACIDVGAKGFIPKSLQPEMFISAIKMIAKGGTYIPADYVKQAEGRPPIDPANFSDKELELLELVAHAATNKEIALKFGLQEVTVKFYLTRIYRKLGARNRAQAAFLALQSRLVEDKS